MEYLYERPWNQLAKEDFLLGWNLLSVEMTCYKSCCLIYRWKNLSNKLLQFRWYTNKLFSFFFFSDKINIGILSAFHRASFMSHKRNNLFHFIISCKYFTFFKMVQWLLYWHCTAFLECISIFLGSFVCCTLKLNWEHDVHLGWKWRIASLSRYINAK